MLKQVSLFWGVLLLLAPWASAHPYLPLAPGNTLTYDYMFRVETTRKEFKQADTDGSITAVCDEWLEKNSKRYLRQVTTYEGIPFMKEKVMLWRRDDPSGIYIGQENKPGVISDTIELPADVSVGVEWSYDDGAKSVRKVARKLDYTLPSGERLEDCIEVVRRIPSNPAWQDFSIYCRGIGAVETKILQKTPVGLYRTETRLRSYKKAP
jgi:hypothetical protein